MTNVFIRLLNMSISAGWIVLAVLLLRPFLKKAPKWVNCALWGIVALRLLIPFAIQSPVSLIPSAEVFVRDEAVIMPAIQSGIPALNGAVNPVLSAANTVSMDQIFFVAAIIWAAGAAALFVYSAITYLILRMRVRPSLKLEGNIYICDDLDTPFVLGIFAPKIYMSSGLSEEQRKHVLAHENAHIKRRDHWWKPLGFLLLSVYWFNPLLWIAYVLLCRDIEQACDEKVIAQMDGAGKKSYMETLVACSVHRRLIMACPVAFGEMSVKARIKGIFHYKKPTLWIVIACSVVLVVTAVCFLTSPAPCEHTYTAQITQASTCTQEGVQTYTCEHCQYAYTEPVEVIAHTYDDGAVTEAATCTQQGTKLYACVDCGETKTEKLEMIPHFGEETYITVEPNCSQQGELSATCAACGAVYVAQVLETNDVHDFSEKVLQAATCSAEGTGIKECSRCDYTEDCAYEKLAHSFYDGVTIPGTCTLNGYQQKICSVCGFDHFVETPKTGEHSWMYNPFGGETCRYCYMGRSGPERSYSNYEINDYGSITSLVKKPSQGGVMPSVQIWP